MTEHPTSGNRWEPTETQPVAAWTPYPAAASPADVGWRSWPASVWTAIVAVGVAAFLASGIGGYAVGQAHRGPTPSGPTVVGSHQDGGRQGFGGQQGFGP